MATLPAAWLLGWISCFLIQAVTPEDVMFAGANDDFDFDGLPGVQHEFKVDIPAGREECFYQNAKAGATFYMTFQVLRGADRNIDVAVKSPEGDILDSHLWVHEGTTEKEIRDQGTYAICVDNTFSRFSSKLVYIYIITYVVADWQHFADEMKSFDGSVGNFTESLTVVDKNVHNMLRLQALSRQGVISDWYLISGNNSYIQKWSIAMCAIILVSSGIQVYFVRRLFSSQNVKSHGGTKERA